MLPYRAFLCTALTRPPDCCSDKAVTVDGFVDVTKHNETALMQSVSHTVSVWAG